MQLHDERVIRADRQEVWAALLNPDVLKECIPGASEVTGTPDDGFEATVTQKVGPVRTTLIGYVSLTNMVEPERLTLNGEGRGRAESSARAAAHIILREAEGGTRLIYEVDARVGGRFAQLGSRVVDSFARRMADQFFGNLQAIFAQRAEAEAVAGAAAPRRKKSWLRRLLGKNA